MKKITQISVNSENFSRRTDLFLRAGIFSRADGFFATFTGGVISTHVTSGLSVTANDMAPEQGVDKTNDK